jgi:serine/threonine-protein kinase
LGLTSDDWRLRLAPAALPTPPPGTGAVQMTDDLRATLEQALAADYVLLDELPRGGMSRVFLANEKALHRKVVLKVLDPELAATLSAERFKREIALAARLQHPHIVPLLHAGQLEGTLFYSMPYVEGESLRELMARERPMSMERVAQILTEVAGALDFAHGQGVVHRDIKPENVMLFRGQAVVLDFGIAKALSNATASTPSTATAPRITLPGTSLGTPTYIAPEQAAGDPALDHRADLYSIGCVAYEMLTGHPPFRGKTPQAVMIAHAREAPEPVTKRRPDTPAPLARLVMRCLAKSPDDRPRHARELVDALRPDQAHTGFRAALERAPWWLPWALAAVSTAAAIGVALARRV